MMEQHLIVLDQNELVVNFFLPIPSSLGVGNGTPRRTFSRVEMYELSLMRAFSGDLVATTINEQNSFQLEGKFDARNLIVQSEYRNEEVEPYRLAWLRAAVLFHESMQDPLERDNFRQAYITMLAASEGITNVDEIKRKVQEFSSSVMIDVAEGESSDNLTIAECSIGLRISLLEPLSSFPSFNINLEDVDAIAVPESIDDRDDTPVKWEMFEVRDLSDLPQGLLAERVYRALDIALDEIRRVQRAVYLVKRTAAELLSRERLPFLVPISARRLKDVGDEAATQKSFLTAHSKKILSHLPSALSVNEISNVFSAANSIDADPFLAYLDFYREAQVSLDKGGDYRSAAISAAAAAESLLDNLLLFLMWEEGLRPEEAATSENWKEAFVSRVKRSYSSRLNGVWDLTQNGPVGEWSRQTAALRNRVIHGAYEPTRPEVDKSLKVVSRLVNFLGDRLADNAVFRRYPRAALTLIGPTRLAERGVSEDKISNLQNNINEVAWIPTFYRWRECWRRVRRDEIDPRKSDPMRSTLLYIVSDQVPYWCLRDRVTAQALIVDVSMKDVPEVVRNQIDQVSSDLNARAGRYSISFEAKIDYSFNGAGWVEEYRLVPLAEVMVDRSDYDHVD